MNNLDTAAEELLIPPEDVASKERRKSVVLGIRMQIEVLTQMNKAFDVIIELLTQGQIRDHRLSRHEPLRIALVDLQKSMHWYLKKIIERFEALCGSDENTEELEQLLDELETHTRDGYH